MLCQYLAVFGWIDEDDEGAICPGQKLKGGRAGERAGGEGRDGADRSIQFNMRGEEDRERQREEDELSTGCLESGPNFRRRSCHV